MYTDANGKRRQVSGATRSACQSALNDATGKARAGELPLPAKLTVEGWLATWMKDHMTHLADRSRHNYTQVIEKHINPAVGRRLLNGPERLSSTDVQRMLNVMADAGLSETMRQHTYGILDQALKKAVNSEPPLMGKNPLAAIPRPGRDTEPTIPWTDEQTAAFRESIEGDRLEGMWTLALLCGLRQGPSRSPVSSTGSVTSGSPSARARARPSSWRCRPTWRISSGPGRPTRSASSSRPVGSGRVTPRTSCSPPGTARPSRTTTSADRGGSRSAVSTGCRT
jgi:hypothetical protein